MPTDGRLHETTDEPTGARTRRALSDAVLVVGSGWQCRLKGGQYLIGRDTTCRICTPDALASREHARLSVRSSGVTIEDLGSANGVFVNTVRITEPHLLLHGDRVLIGTTELGMYGVAPDDSQGFSEDDRPTLTGTEGPTHPGATVRASAIEVLGRVAERFLAANAPAQARRVLADQLVKVLTGARSGQRVSRELCLEASRYALLLGRALGEGAWIDYTMELHLRGEHPMAPETLDDLVSALPQVVKVDGALFDHYVTWLQQGSAKQSGVASLVAARLRELELPGVGPSR